MKIRDAAKTDLPAIQNVIETAFPADERELIINLAAEFLREHSQPPVKSLIAEIDHHIVGYVSYSPIFLDINAHLSGYILAPLAISPEYQKQGVGTRLIQSGVDMLIEDQVVILFVYGDPAYYGRFGFSKEPAQSFIPPYPLEFPFGWLGQMLRDAVLPEQHTSFHCVPALSKPEIW